MPRDAIKVQLRAAVEAVLSRLPLARAAYRQRDAARAYAAELEAEIHRLRPTPPESDRLGAATQMAQLDPMRLEALVPIARTVDERVLMGTRCRDADSLPRVPNAGAIVEQDDGTRLQIMHNGLKVVAGGYYGHWMQDLITRCRGLHEPQEEVLFAEVLRHLPARAAMLELGGFWSFYSLWFLAGDAMRRSVVVEADPANMEVGRANARVNQLAPTFINAAVGATPSPPAPFATETSGVRELACVTVESVMEQCGIEHLDLLHCDAQGVELEVLRSCAGLAAAGRLTWIMVSTHSHHISGDPLTHQRCLAMLQQLGAAVVAEHDVHESYSGDGLILAKFGPMPANWRTPPLSFNRYSESLFRNPLYDLAAQRT